MLQPYIMRLDRMKMLKPFKCQYFCFVLIQTAFQKMTTLFDKLGGANAIDAVVDKFYEFMLVDPEINHFFKNTDMNKQRMRQKQFITLVTGGPHNYQGKDMKTAHQKMKITKKDFDTTWKHLLQALRFYKVSENLISETKDIFYSTESDIVTVKQTSNQTLYQRLGGEPAINAVVNKFYEYMLSDPITSPFFANVDMKKQATKQKQFIIMVTGGPNKYEGVDMKKAHEKFKIGKKEFDQTWFNLQKALSFFKVSKELIGEVKVVFYSVEDDVLTVKQAPKKTLYERIGGQPALSAVVDKFYEYMLSDPITSPFFANTDMKKQATRQKQFIAMAIGGPNKYQGEDMKKAHEKFKIGKKEFDQTWFNLQKALSFFKVNKAEVAQIKAVFYSVQDDVLTVKQPQKPVDQKLLEFSKAALLNPNIKLFKKIIGGLSPSNPVIKPEATLYQKLGGQGAISAVIDKFYQYMLSDPITSPFFANVDMKKQATRQKQFIVMVTGGPNKYEGADMKKAHEKFKIGMKEFDQTWLNLQKALAFFKVNKGLVGEVKTIFYSVQDDVIRV